MDQNRNLFNQTQRPNPEWFHKSHDPNDPRLGEMVSREPQDFETSQVVILGSPQDEGVRRNRGRPGARKGPQEIRRAFYKLSPSPSFSSLRIFDIGNVVLGNTLEETHETQEKVVYQILKQDKLVVVLGGGNDISYPDCAALAKIKTNILVFNIDKHYDVRELTPRNSGTPYRLLLENKLIDPQKLYEMGSEPFSNSQIYTQYLHKKGAHVVSLQQMRERGITSLFQEILDKHTSSTEAVFWGFDLDSVRSSDAPGVSASYPTGLTASEICQIAQIAGKKTTRGIIEFTEINPDTDLDHRTSQLTAILIHTFLSSFSENKPRD